MQSGDCRSDTKRRDGVTMPPRIGAVVIGLCVACLCNATHLDRIAASRIPGTRTWSQYSGVSQISPRGGLQVPCMRRATPTFLCDKHDFRQMAGAPTS